MKTRYIIELLIIISFTFSCEDFLEEEPPVFISTTNFYQTAVDARTATDAIYESLQDGSSNSIYGRWWAGIDIGTDDITSRTNRNNYGNWLGHTMNPSDVWLEAYQVYQNLWRGVGRANDVIQFVPQIDMDEAEKAAIIGEARALRALLYLHLVKTWGDVPLVVNSIESTADFNLPRSSVDEVYDQIIIPDLQFSEENCLDGLHTGRVTRWTAKMILADVYMTRAGWRRTSQGQFVQGDASNWALARDKAKEIIDQSPHSLITEPYVDGQHISAACIVPWIESLPYSVESIFELGAVNVAGFGSWLTRDCSPNANGTRYWGAAGGRPLEGEGINSTVAQLRFAGRPATVGMFIPTPDIAEHYEAGDERREAFLMTRYTTPEGDNYLCQPTVRKYVDIDYFLGAENTSFLNTNRNWLLYRYADALLIYAEAQNEADAAPNGDAYAAVNEIRNRAGLADLDPGLSQQDFRVAVWRERRSEFVGEMKRKFDLVRTNRLRTETENIRIQWDTDIGSLTSYINANPLYATTPFPDNEWLLPIPQSEMELNTDNGWVQNEGYAGGE
ncbi:MAG: RagB/SusD family nutrient uptake outer membrane protein [Bacteroidota bacterium]